MFFTIDKAVKLPYIEDSRAKPTGHSKRRHLAVLIG